MKHYYRYSIMFLLIALAAAFFVFKNKNKTAGRVSATGKNVKVPILNAAKPEVVPQATMSKIQQGLVEREYHITFDSEKASLQSPNRKQNLRAYYKPGILTVQNRKDSAGHNFKLKLVTEGIYADGSKIHSPQAGANVDNNDGQLDIKHAGFTEQYINNQEGIRQNFVVQSAPKGTNQLQVHLSVNGLKVNDVGGNELHFYNENQEGTIEKQLVYKDLKCWDATGKELLASLTYQNGKIVISVNALNAVYPVTIDPIVVNGNPGNANSTAESNQAGANAGHSVSSAGDVNGDGYSDVLVGAPYYDKGENNEGAVLVYYGSATGLGANPALILESNQAEARFGHSVSTAGDVNKDGFSDVVIGAPYYDKGQTNEGAAFVYHGSVNGLSAIAVTVLESNQVEAHFGNAVALAGDANADGFSDVIVGAPWYDKGQTDEGAAFVYHGSAAGVIVNAKITLESNQVAAKMGNAVAGAGDVNGDGYSDVIVGSFWYDKGQNNEGAAFIYHGGALGISGIAVSILESNQADAVLGFSVASAGDVNGDGYSDVIVGAYLYDKGQNNEGAAFVYQGSAAGININAAVTLESNQADAQAGYSVASAGDVNGDGYSDVIVGANIYDKGESNEGAAFVYQGSAVGIYANAVSTLESNQVDAGMGNAVASAGDVNGDGYSDVVVGASLFENGQVDEGAGFVWFGKARGVDMALSTLEMNQETAQFGCSVSSAGDVNGDGFDDIIVGANEFDNGQLDEGVAFVYYGSSSGVNSVPTAFLEIDRAYSGFGNSVSSAGDVNGDGFGDVIVGASLYDNGQNNEGAIFIFHGSAQGILKTIKAKAESDQEDASMGFSVATAGDVNGDGFSDVVVGVPGFDISAPYMDEGEVFVFQGSLDGINSIPSIVIKGDLDGFYKGNSVASAGDLNKDGYGDILVGNPFYSKDESYEGAVFIYPGSPSGVTAEPLIILESNQQDARLGMKVASAGDLNGDGYNDLIIGASEFTSGQYHEGAAYLYYGSSIGINTLPQIIEGNQANASMGNSVASAGDLNGDGYGDIIIGALGFQNGQINEGAFFLYYGSSSGIIVNTGIKFEGNQESAFMGHSVASAGDANGDGYSDIVIGAHQYDNGQYNEGTVSIYYGNSGKNLKNNLRLYNSNLTTPINQTQFSKNNFGAGLFARSFLGRGKGAMVWETKAKGQAFSKGANDVITNSTQFTNRSLFTNMGLTGTEIKSLIPKQGPSTKVRVRVKYDPSTALTGQTYGPWRYLPAYLTGSSIAPVPENAMAETVKRKVEVSEKANFAERVSIYPNPVSDKLFIDSQNPEDIRGAQLMTTGGKLVNKFNGGERAMDVRGLESGVYILIVTHNDGSQISRKVVIRR